MFRTFILKPSRVPIKTVTYYFRFADLSIFSILKNICFPAVKTSFKANKKWWLCMIDY